MKERSHVAGRTLDFWLLGGASILVWLVMMVGQHLRQDESSIQTHFLQIAATFGLLGLIVNHPHFMMSYRLGYGRGHAFIFRHWFCLIVVPLGMLAALTLAYFQFRTNIGQYAAVGAANRGLASSGTSFRLGELANLGTEILSLMAWAMYLTVGWHYSKQAFGCFMVYAKFDGYPLTSWQRKLIKASMFSVAIFNFAYLNLVWMDSNTGQSAFQNIPMISLGLPTFLLPLSLGLVGSAMLAVVLGVFVRNYRASGALPSPTMLVPWIAFHVWWIPIAPQQEFYLMMVPFFHSLQYLPFAFRMEAPRIKPSRFREANITARLLLLFLVGFLAFEWVPGALDTALKTNYNQTAWFFSVAFLVFINVHHFFIDSVVWKFHQPQVREALF